MSSPTGIQFTIASNPATQFAGAIASGANSGIVDLQLPKQLFGPSVLRSLVILSVQQLAWELDWFSNDSGEGATPGTDTWLGRWMNDHEKLGYELLGKPFLVEANHAEKDEIDAGNMPRALALRLDKARTEVGAAVNPWTGE